MGHSDKITQGHCNRSEWVFHAICLGKSSFLNVLFCQRFGKWRSTLALASVALILQTTNLDPNRRSRYNTQMIQSFVCGDTERLFKRLRVPRFATIESVARRKLDQLNAAEALSFLRVPPGNRLKALKGDRAGQYSIRVNDQFRLCFVWAAQGPGNVELVDYH